jgi:hypothetical protein
MCVLCTLYCKYVSVRLLRISKSTCIDFVTVSHHFNVFARLYSCTRVGAHVGSFDLA